MLLQRAGFLYLIWLEASDRIANAADFAHDDNEHFPVIVARKTHRSWARSYLAALIVRLVPSL
jgi:hypothetical protein